MPSWIKRFSVLILLTPIIGSLIWYIISFYPHVEKLNDWASKGTQTVNRLNNNIYSYAVVAESKPSIRYYAIRQAYRSLTNNTHQSNLAWHSVNALWLASSYLHFDDNEIFGLWVECALFKCGLGLGEAAKKYYHKSIIDLSERELVGLIVLTKNPERYTPGSRYSEERIKKVLNQNHDSQRFD